MTSKWLRPPKILYVGLVPPSVGGSIPGGIASHTWDLARAAHRNGYVVAVLGNVHRSVVIDGVRLLAPPRKSDAHAMLNIILRQGYSAIQQVYLERRLTARAGISTKLVWQVAWLQDYVDRFSPDIVHVHGLANPIIRPLSILHRKPPLVATDHGTALVYEHNAHAIYGKTDESDGRNIIERNFTKLDAVISVSEFAAHKLAGYFDIPKDLSIGSILNPITVNDNHTDASNKVKRTIHLGSNPIVLFSSVSHPMTRKGLDILLMAYGEDPKLRSNTQLIIVTSKEGCSQAKVLATRYGISAHFLPPQEWSILASYYSIADVLVVPSAVEGIGLVYEEALSFGTPVIGFPDSVKELSKALGTYIGEEFDRRVETPSSLSAKIWNVLSAGVDRPALRKRAVASLSWNSQFPKYDAVYTRVAGVMSQESES